MALIEYYYGPDAPFESDRHFKNFGPDDKDNLFTADSFLNFIRRSNPTWYHNDDIPIEQEWVYRGHWNSHWRLVPSAGREFEERNPLKLLIEHKMNSLSQSFSVRDITLTDNQKKCYSFTCAAWDAYYQFNAQAYKYGYIAEPTPDTYIQRYDIVFRLANTPKNSPQSANHQVIFNRHLSYIPHHRFTEVATHLHLAQHHDIPTFLLDWSYNPWTAAHFATNSNIDNKDHHDICIWAINIKLLKKRDKNPTLENTKFGNFNEIQIVDVATMGNDYLAAQDGILTELKRDFNIWENTGYYPCLTQIIDKWFQIRNSLLTEPKDKSAIINADRPILRKMVLPKAEIPKLRKLLRLEGISRAKLKPNLDSVAKDALDKAHEELP